MRIKPNSQAGLLAGAWILLIFFVIFIIIIFGVAICMIRTIQKIVPPPPPDDDGIIHMPPVGSKYQGGTVDGYVPPPHVLKAAPSGFTVNRVYIFASDNPSPEVRTNCIWSGDLADVTNVMGSNGLPVESWPAGQMPSQRYYNICISNSNQ